MARGDDKDQRKASRLRAGAAASGGMARMSDVARLAGVTAMTVSRVLRTPEKVSAQTRNRVEEAIHRSGFIPNYAARSLVSRRSQVVIALFPTVMNSVFSGMIEVLSRRLAEHGYHLLLGETEFDIAIEEAQLMGLIGWRPAGILVTGSEHTVGTRAILENSDAPVVELWTLPKEPFDLAVGFSNFDATYQMTQSLFAWGYRRVALMYLAFLNNDRTVDRRNGYRKARAVLGLPQDESLEIGVPAFGAQPAREGLRQLLAARPDVDAVLCASDTLAIGALMEALRMGRKVPDEIAITGFGDVELAAELVPSLTTVRLPRFEIGRISADVILKRIAGTYDGPSVIDCGFSIVRRESA
ncbi:LacI family DNA-binding transcriptional regulator [Mesorhizobium sp. A623]